MRPRGFSIASVLIVLLSAAIVLVSFAPAVLAPPPTPYTTFGMAFDSTGTRFPQGTPIRTFIDGVDYSNKTSVYDNTGSFYVDTFGNWAAPATTQAKEGGDIGDAIMYASGELAGASPGGVARETSTWAVGGLQNLNLNLASTQPPLLKIQSLTVRPSTGNQYAYLCNPTAALVNAGLFFFQRDAPGTFNGPSFPLSGTIRAGGRLFVDLTSTTWLDPAGDALKLVWANPGGPGAPNGGANIVVDRVEFNATSTGALTWEPGNTIMTDAPAPGAGQEIHRNDVCADTNAGADFTIGAETGGPAAPAVTVSYPNGGERFTGGSTHTIYWNMTDTDPDSALLVNVSYSLDGLSYTEIAAGLTKTDPSSHTWTVPVADTNLARVQVCARDRTDLLGCGRSAAPFSIDSTPPQVQSTDPANGAVGVPLAKVIRIVFNEAMQPAPTDVTLVPAAGTLTFTWVDARTLDVAHSAPFLGCQGYRLDVGIGFLDASLPGNALLPASVTFDTICAPNVALVSPIGGEVYSGGAVHTITWTMSDEQASPLLTTWVNLSTNSGLTYPISIDGPSLRSEGTVGLAWTVNSVNTIHARIQVCVGDETRLVTCTTSPTDFTIDSTPPTVVSTSPANSANDVLPADPVVITFSERMNATSVTVTFAPNPGGILPSWDPTGTILTLGHNPFSSASTTVTVQGTSKDASDPGNPLGSNYVFTFGLDTAPTLSITAPVAGDCWCGGTTHTIAWTMDDAESGPGSLVVYINVSTSGGLFVITPTGLGPGLSGSPSYPWSLPAISELSAHIEITAIDPRGLSITRSSGTFRIDSAAPTLNSQPVNNQQNVPTNQVITLAWSEAMDPVATQGAITVSPLPAGMTFLWAGNTLEIHHSGLAPGVTYTVTITTAAHDNCTPGNAFAGATIRFTTAANQAPQVHFTAPTAIETWNVGDSKVITWSMSDETPAAQLRVWLNYTSAVGSGTLVNGQAGATQVTWTVPAALAGRTVQFHIDVVDALDARGSDTSVSVNVAAPPGGIGDVLPWIGLAIVIIGIIAGLLFFLVVKRRKKEEPAAPAPKKAPSRPPGKAAPAKPAGPPKAAPAAPAAEETESPLETEEGGETKTCPNCGSIVDATATQCPVCDAAL